MNDGVRYSIGELARRTGLTVKAVRFYSDQGIVPPTDRSQAGYRRYGTDALARLELVRTLRDLGLDLATVRRVVEREVSLAEVAAAHAEALAVQIRTLRLRRAVLTAAARRGASPEEMDLMHRLAKLSEDERRSLIGEFLEAVFSGAGAWAGIARSLTPELPEHPEPEQVEAWVELAELAQDPEFRAALRRTAEYYAAEIGTAGLRRDPAAAVRDLVRPALEAGVDPASPEAGQVVAVVLADHAPGADGQVRLLARLKAANDPRRDRYVELLAAINGWPAPESLAPSLAWFIEAMRTVVGAPTAGTPTT